MRLYEVTKTIYGPLFRGLKHLAKRMHSTDKEHNTKLLPDARHLRDLIDNAATYDDDDVRHKAEAQNQIRRIIRYLEDTKA